MSFFLLDRPTFLGSNSINIDTKSDRLILEHNGFDTKQVFQPTILKDEVYETKLRWAPPTSSNWGTDKGIVEFSITFNGWVDLRKIFLEFGI